MSEGDRPVSELSQTSSTATISSVSMGTKPRSARPVRKVHAFGKRENSVKRDPNSPVIMRGWLYKKDSSGLKLWKRRWFVLSNFCLYYYRDSREEMILGSIPLPSYEIRTAFSKEKKNRRFVFKAEHPGMRTYYFSADTQLDMNSWIKAMNQSSVAECDYGSYNWVRHSQSACTHGSFDEYTLTQDDYAKSTESLEIAHLSETREAEASSSESLKMPNIGQDRQKESPCRRRISSSSSLNGGYPHERKEQPDLSSLSSQTHGSPSPLPPTKPSSRPCSPPPPPSDNPSPSSLSRSPQPSPLLSTRSSRSYSLPLNPLDSPRMLEVCPSPSRARRKPPRAAAVQAASCEDLSATTSQRTFMRPNTPMGRVDIAPSKGPPSNPYAILSPGTRGCPLTPADRYDVLPSSEDPYGRRYTRNPHPSRGRLAGEEGPAPSLARQLQNRAVDRNYLSPLTGPSRALVVSRLHGRLITPHSASSSYLNLPPLPPLPNRPTPGKRAGLAIVGRNPARERSLHPAGGQRFESDTDALLTKLCGQDKLLRGLEEDMGQLRSEKERLEKVLEVTRLRLEEFKGQDATVEKICYQQRQVQDELVQIRARLCDVALDSERAWEDYAVLENELQVLKGSLEHIRSVGHPQDQATAQQDLWRIHDILTALKASPANYQTLASRRSGVPSIPTPALDSHLGMNHSPLPPCTGAEKESETLSPSRPLHSFHESTLSPVPDTQEPARTAGQSERRQQVSPREQPSPPASSRGQQGPLRCSDRIRRSPNGAFSDSPPDCEQRSPPGRETEGIRADHGSSGNKHCEEGQNNLVKVVSHDSTSSRRSRMSAQEQLDRMQRNQEAQRKSEAPQSSLTGRWRDSLKRGSSWPLPNTPLEPSPKEGVQTEGLKPRCSPTPEWERQRVIQLSYALAAEASQLGKLITGRTSSHSSLNDNSESQDSPNHHQFPSDSNVDDPESNNITSKQDQTATQSPACCVKLRTASQTPSSSQASSQVLCGSEASSWSLPPPEVSRVLSQPKVAHSRPYTLESANEPPFLLQDPNWNAHWPQSPNRNMPVSRSASWASPQFWDCEVWASEQSLVGNQGPANGTCLRWRDENKSHQMVAYLSETARPIKVTLLKSSF